MSASRQKKKAKRCLASEIKTQHRLLLRLSACLLRNQPSRRRLFLELPASSARRLTLTQRLPPLARRRSHLPRLSRSLRQRQPLSSEKPFNMHQYQHYQACMIKLTPFMRCRETHGRLSASAPTRTILSNYSHKSSCKQSGAMGVKLRNRNVLNASSRPACYKHIYNNSKHHPL